MKPDDRTKIFCEVPLLLTGVSADEIKPFSFTERRMIKFGLIRPVVWPHELDILLFELLKSVSSTFRRVSATLIGARSQVQTPKKPLKMPYLFDTVCNKVSAML